MFNKCFIFLKTLVAAPPSRTKCRMVWSLRQMIGALSTNTLLEGWWVCWSCNTWKAKVRRWTLCATPRRRSWRSRSGTWSRGTARCRCSVAWATRCRGRGGASGTSPPYLLRQPHHVSFSHHQSHYFCFFISFQCRTYCPSPEILWNQTTMASTTLPLEVDSLYFL